MTTHFPPPPSTPRTPILPDAQPTPEGGVLGKLAKSVNADLQKHQSTRSRLFSLQRTAASILGRERVGKCLWSIADNSTGVRVLRRETRARFDGLQTCGSVWHCPVCSHRISETRRQELNDALSQARLMGLDLFLITLTTSHKDGDDLPALLDNLKLAKKHFQNSRTYKGYKHLIKGGITATELTHGVNGWHPHFHIILFTEKLPDESRWQLQLDFEQQWITSLQARGLSGNRPHAFRMDDATAAGGYVAKWGAAEELTMGAKKDGKSKGRHPFQILQSAAHNPHDKHLFYEYAMAFKGRRQLQWTPGLRDLLKVELLTDEEASVIEPNNEDEWLISITSDDWSSVRKKGRSRILQTCEHETPDHLPACLVELENSPDEEH